MDGIIIARSITTQLKEAGVDARHNLFGLTICFPKPSPALIDKYSLAWVGAYAHMIVTSNNSDTRPSEFAGAGEFVDEYLSELRKSAGAPSNKSKSRPLAKVARRRQSRRRLTSRQLKHEKMK